MLSMLTTEAECVFRHNTVQDAYIESHSVFTQNRGAKLWEIYDNTIAQVSVAYYMPFRLRGGTGVVFNNTITGTWSDGHIGLDIVRGDANNDTLGSPPGFAYGLTRSDWTFSAPAKTITTDRGNSPPGDGDALGGLRLSGRRRHPGAGQHVERWAVHNHRSNVQHDHGHSILGQ